GRFHIVWCPTARAQIGHTAVAIGLAELLRRRLHDQWMVAEQRRRRSSGETREPNLPAGGGQEIDAANDVRDLLEVVVDRRRPLICPVAEAIADQEITALPRRI